MPSKHANCRCSGTRCLQERVYTTLSSSSCPSPRSMSMHLISMGPLHVSDEQNVAQQDIKGPNLNASHPSNAAN